MEHKVGDTWTTDKEVYGFKAGATVTVKAITHDGRKLSIQITGVRTDTGQAGSDEARLPMGNLDLIGTKN